MDYLYDEDENFLTNKLNQKLNFEERVLHYQNILEDINLEYFSILNNSNISICKCSDCGKTYVGVNSILKKCNECIN